MRSLDGLVTHERIHAYNVQELMLRAAQARPELYAEAIPYIAPFGGTHDVPKSYREIAELLCSIYGMNLEEQQSWTPERREEVARLRRTIIDRLNETEDALKHEVLIKKGLIKPDGSPRNAKAGRIVGLLKRLEKIADNVERVGNPISAEELGKRAMDAKVSFERYLAGGFPVGEQQGVITEAYDLLGYYHRENARFTGHVQRMALTIAPKRGFHETLVASAKGRVHEAFSSMKEEKPEKWVPRSPVMTKECFRQFGALAN